MPSGVSVSHAGCIYFQSLAYLHTHTHTVHTYTLHTHTHKLHTYTPIHTHLHPRDTHPEIFYTYAQAGIFNMEYRKKRFDETISPETRTLRKLYFHFLSNWMGYIRDDSFPFHFLNQMEFHLVQNRKENTPVPWRWEILIRAAVTNACGKTIFPFH